MVLREIYTPILVCLIGAFTLTGCDSAVQLECDKLIEALSLIPQLHVAASPTFNPRAFQLAQTRLLKERHVTIPKKYPTDSHDQCQGTLELLRDSFPKSALRQFTLELISNYTRQWDPHSTAMSESELASQSGFLTGFGFSIDRTDSTGRVEVVDVIAGSPAHSAGLKEGMFIWAINRRYMRDISAGELTSLINDRSSEELVLGVLGVTNSQNPTQSYREIRIPRGVFEASPLKLNTFRLRYSRADVNVGYVKLRSFVGVQAIFAEALKSLKSSSDALILDLRNISGGEIQGANEVADLLLSDPETFVGLMGRTGRVNEIIKMKIPSSAWDGPLIVLVNSATKSAAEILAGALQDYGAIVVGTQTFGKGTRQQLIALENYNLSGGLFITDAFTVRPSGHLIQFKGITPDITLVTRGEIKAEKDYSHALTPPADKGPLPGYDPSLVLSRSRQLREKLSTLEKQIRDYIKSQNETASQDDLQLEAAKRVAVFMAAEADPSATHNVTATPASSSDQLQDLLNFQSRH